MIDLSPVTILVYIRVGCLIHFNHHLGVITPKHNRSIRSTFTNYPGLQSDDHVYKSDLFWIFNWNPCSLDIDMPV